MICAWSYLTLISFTDHITVLVVRFPRDKVMTKRLRRATDGNNYKTDYDDALKFDVQKIGINHIADLCDPSSTAPFCKLLKVPDNSRRDGSVALHVLERQSVCGDRLHCWWQRHAGGTQCEAGSDPGR